MKNKEKYIDEFIEASCHDDICGFVNKYVQSVKELEDEEKGCWDGCKYCMEELKKWLEQEYDPEQRLSHDEYVILKNVYKTFGWIARNKDSLLIVASKRPDKKEEDWYSYNRVLSFALFQHLFQFIKWEDEEPYNIRKLLDEYESYVMDY